MALTMQLFILVLLPAAFLWPPAAWAGEIIGGREAQPHSRPYMAYLEIQNGKESFNCGGFLVSENFVLTAAHCNGDKITVTLGAHNINEPDGKEEMILAERHVPHPQYTSIIGYNDIMLLKLSYKATLTNRVKPINLPSAPHRVPPGTLCNVAGWGDTSMTDTTDTLREVNLKVMSDWTCFIRYFFFYYPSSMLCAEDPKDIKTTYNGDSGGPLVCGGVAEGIVSYGKSDATPPAVYTRISHFLPWITRTMRRI